MSKEKNMDSIVKYLKLFVVVMIVTSLWTDAASYCFSMGLYNNIVADVCSNIGTIIYFVFIFATFFIEITMEIDLMKIFKFILITVIISGVCLVVTGTYFVASVVLTLGMTYLLIQLCKDFYLSIKKQR